MLPRCPSGRPSCCTKNTLNKLFEAKLMLLMLTDSIMHLIAELKLIMSLKRSHLAPTCICVPLKVSKSLCYRTTLSLLPIKKQPRAYHFKDIEVLKCHCLLGVSQEGFALNLAFSFPQRFSQSTAVTISPAALSQLYGWLAFFYRFDPIQTAFTESGIERAGWPIVKETCMFWLFRSLSSLFGKTEEL